jgi:hypothetical protein
VSRSHVLGEARLCGFTGVDECKRLTNNKEDEVVGGRSPTLGEPRISCVFGLLCAMLFML